MEKKHIDEETTKKIAKGTRIIVIAVSVLLLAWDIVAATWQGRNDTISEWIRNWSRTSITLPFFGGALMSHFFVNLGQPESYQIRFYLFAGVMVSCIGADVARFFIFSEAYSVEARISAVFFGFGAALLLWCQNP